jgi:hypothetical protein
LVFYDEESLELYQYSEIVGIKENVLASIEEEDLKAAGSLLLLVLLNK